MSQIKNSEQQKKPKSLHKSKSRDKSGKKDKTKQLELKHIKSKRESENKAVKLGICAMKKKVLSKPMRQIIKRISCEEIQIIEMWEFLDKHYKAWPPVDALICFYSEGFPYLKAWKYVRKHKPFLINSLEKQELLWDRTAVYDILNKIHIPVAKHFMVFRDLDYVNEIEMKCFGEDNEDDNRSQVRSQVRGQTKTEIRESQVQSPKSSIHHPSFEETFQIEERKKSKNDDSDNQIKLIQDERYGSEKSKRNPVRKQTYELEAASSLEKGDQYSKLDSSLEKREPITATIKRRDIGHEVLPYTLRKHHEDRLGKIEKYEIEEIEDYILIKGSKGSTKLKKPFVEKPFDAENHNICIYYPESMGGGRKALFRKVKNSSSKFEENENCIRRDANYIYEEYLPTNAFDIKVYTIGSFYMYAEARKSPTLDGVVERDVYGKEKRFPIILTPEEKFMSKKIVQEFGQEVCGFDLLRANGKSYVCDVNGWSFVKSNSKYWDDCSIILKRKIFAKFMPEKLGEEGRFYQRFSIDSENLYRPPLKNILMKKEELRSIVSIFRHGDRSPKLKLKFKTSQKRFIDLLKQKGNNANELKVKDVKGLTHLLEITNIMMESEDLKKEDLQKLGQMRMVLESGGHFEGLNRKCQLKVSKRNEEGEIVKLEIVVKWGGELSLKGFNDAMDLGRRMRMEKYKDDQDFLSLHSSYRHDLKTYSSDEGRCIKTAASFLKGFLNIEGGLAPIITSMVMTNKRAQNLLDCTSEQNHSQLAEYTVKKLSQIMNSDEDLLKSYTRIVEKEKISSEMLRIIEEIGKPREKLKKIHKEIVKLVLILQNSQLAKSPDSDSAGRNSGVSHEERVSEDGSIIYRRWSKLQKDFYSQKQMKFNISKVPQIYDTIRHDLNRNQYIFKELGDYQFNVKDFKRLSRLLAQFVVPNEHGLTDENKIATAQEIASPLLRKILSDLMFWKDMNYEDQYWKYTNEGENYWRHIRTRLYFTSASHIYSVMHLMTLGCNRQLLNSSSPEYVEEIRKFVYMSYLSHIEFRLYENFEAAAEDPNRFRVQISLSPSYSKDNPITEASFNKNGYTINEIQDFLRKIVKKDAFSQQKQTKKKISVVGNERNEEEKKMKDTEKTKTEE